MKRERQAFVQGSGGTRLYATSEGTGPAAVILNDGVGCDGFAWRYLTPALAEHCHVIRWHYPGHGRSGRPASLDDLSVEGLARDMWRVLDAFEVERAVIGGHSMGTQVSLEAYRLRADRVQGLALICGSSGRITHTFHGTDLLSQVLPGVLEGLSRFTGVGRAMWGRIPASVAFNVARLGREIDGQRIQEADFRRYWDHVSLMDPEVFLRMLERAGEHSAQDLLPAISVPTLVVAAERDTFTPVEYAQQMATQIPNAQCVVIKDGSHAAPVEQPDLILAQLRKLLAQAG